MKDIVRKTAALILALAMIMAVTIDRPMQPAIENAKDRSCTLNR